MRTLQEGYKEQLQAQQGRLKIVLNKDTNKWLYILLHCLVQQAVRLLDSLFKRLLLQLYL
jgi:hypothetical protein